MKQNDMIILGITITEVNPVSVGQSIPTLQDQRTSTSGKAAAGLISASL